MNTNITREELYDKFVTKDYLHDELMKFGDQLERKINATIDAKIDALLIDIRSMILEIGDTLSRKIDALGGRLDRHIADNAIEHSKFMRKPDCD